MKSRPTAAQQQLALEIHIQNANRRLEREIQAHRLRRISRVMDEMAECRSQIGIGPLIGELDLMGELHRLLYNY